MDMKIGYEAKRYFHNFTGLGNYSRSLINALATYYPDNQYYLYNTKSNRKRTYQLPNSTIERQPNTYINKKLSSVWRQKFVSKQIKDDQIDVYHGLSGELPLGLKKYEIPSVLTIHDLIFMRFPEYYNFSDKRIYFQKFKSSAKRADLVIAISEQTKSDIIEFLKIPDEKIQVIYQGCAPEFKINYSKDFKLKIRNKFNLPESFMLYVGTIEERKNLDNLINALPQVDLPLIVIGKKTSYFEKVNASINKLGLKNKVLFPGYMNNEELAALYQMASVFIYPSLFEGFGIPIIEALYSKTPVITSNSGCFPEAGGPNSVYINPEDPDDIANGILSILLNKDKTKLMTQKGYEYAQNFNDQCFAEKWMTCYKNIR